jgi:hypothetical protein
MLLLPLLSPKPTWLAPCPVGRIGCAASPMMTTRPRPKHAGVSAADGRANVPCAIHASGGAAATIALKAGSQPGVAASSADCSFAAVLQFFGF